jgi:uncharacterized protein YkwD
MRKTWLNGDNEDMYRIVLSALIGSSLILAACGGGNKQSSPTQGANPTGNGGVVSAEATKGLIGPAATADEKGSNTIGKTAPLSPKENRPTDAQTHGVAGGVACASVSANPSAANMDSISAAILCLLNAERSSHGLPALKSNGQLGNAANVWAKAMVARRFFSHDSGASTPLSRIKRTGYVHGNWSIGENIAWGSGALATPRSIVNGWMHSPGHRANILRGAFKEIGIGIRLGAPGPGLSGGAVYVTDFGKHS